MTLSRTGSLSKIYEKKTGQGGCQNDYRNIKMTAHSGKYWLLPTCDKCLPYSLSVWAMGQGGLF